MANPHRNQRWSLSVTPIEVLERRQLLSAAAGLPNPAAMPMDLFPVEDYSDPDGGDVGDVQQAAPPAPGEPSVLPAALPVVGGAWTSVGPSPISGGSVPGSGTVSGRITAIAPNPSDHNTIYIGAAGGGVWKTTNGGSSWAPLTDSQPNEAIGALAVAPSNPSIIYAGTGEANNSGDSQYGEGVLKSTDSGATWTLLGTSYFNRVTFSKLVVDPNNANVLYGATSFGINSAGNYGIWKSTDGAVTWTKESSGIPTTVPASDVLIDPTNDQTIYAAIGYAFGSTSNGVYKSINAGSTWTRLTSMPGDGATNAFAGRISLGMTSNPGAGTPILYVAEENDSSYGVLGVYKSPDGGSTWSNITPSSNFMGGQGWYDQYIGVSPTDLTQNTIFVGGAAGSNAIMESTNGGSSWTGINVGASGSNGPHPDHHAIAFDANGTMLDGNDGGIWRLDNPTVGSISWSDLNGNLGITQFQGIAVSNAVTPQILGGSQDNGTSSGTTASTVLTEVEGGDGGWVAISPNNSSRIYHIAPVSSFGTTDFFRRSTNGGNNWSSITPSIGGDSSDFYPPFVVDPSYSVGGNDRLLLGTNHLYESTNSGTNWTALTTTTAAGWNTSENIDAIAMLGNTIYASAAGETYISTNNGTSWVEHDVNSTNAVSELIVDPTNSLNAYAVLAQFTGGSNGKVYRTINGGTTWTDIDGNLPNLPMRSIVLDNSGTPTLYVGSDSGVYISTNQGTTWSQYGTGLPGAAVYDLRENSSGLLVAGTHGRGMFDIATRSVSTTVAVTANSAVIYNQSNTFTATVTPASGSGETGTVQFQVDGVNVGLPVAVVSGSASFSTSTLSLAPHTITANYSGDINFLGSTGSLVVTPLISVPGSASLTLTAGLSATTALRASGVTIGGATGAWTAKLDLTNNSLDIYTATLSTVTNQIGQGYANGSWLGNGIQSSSANGDSTHLTAVGVMQNNQSGTAVYAAGNLFHGVAPGTGDILVKYTYYGDANLSGKVDSADYARIDAGFLSHGSLIGWFNGDFNYDNVINGSDYTLIDNAFNLQGVSLAAQIAAQIATVKPKVFATQLLASPATAFANQNAAQSGAPSLAVLLFDGDGIDSKKGRIV